MKTAEAIPGFLHTGITSLKRGMWLALTLESCSPAPLARHVYRMQMTKMLSSARNDMSQARTGNMSPLRGLMCLAVWALYKHRAPTSLSHCER